MTKPASRAPSLCVELPVSADWASIESLQRALMSRLEAPLSDPELCRTVGMVMSELVENAIKYGDWSRRERASAAVRRRAAEAAGVGGVVEVIEIEVRSPASGRDALDAVNRRIRWIQGFPSAREAFAARVLHLSALSGEAGRRGGGLGLVRIAYEGGCALQAWLSPDERTLHVKATLPGGRLPVEAEGTALGRASGQGRHERG